MPAKKLHAMLAAEELYMAKRLTGVLATYRDSDIINMRIRAFIDGAHWQKRQEKPKRRAPTNGAEHGN